MDRSKQRQSTNSKTQGKEVLEISSQQDEDKSKEFTFKKAGANDEVMQALFDLAKSGKSSTAAIFWAKARCGMKEKGREKKRRVGQTPTIVIRTEEGKRA